MDLFNEIEEKFVEVDGIKLHTVKIGELSKEISTND